MSIPRGTRQYIGLRELATRLGWSHKTVRYWWQEGRIIGRLASGPRARVLVPIELAEFYLRYTRMPTKLELFELNVLTHDYLLELGGPDGGLSELPAPACPTRNVRSQLADGSSATTG